MDNDKSLQPLAKDLMTEDMKQALLQEISSQIDQRDITFPAVKIVHQSKKFEVEQPDGRESVTVSRFEAVILSFDKYRVFFEKRYDPSNPTPPDCISSDTISGIKNESYEGAAGGLCANCPQNEWGTAISDSGEAGKGKACQEKIRLFLMTQNSQVPLEMHLSPTSVGPFKKYIGGLIARLQYPQLLWTEFTLAKGNMNSAVLECSRGIDMSAEDAERWKSIRGLFGAMMQKKLSTMDITSHMNDDRRAETQTGAQDETQVDTRTKTQTGAQDETQSNAQNSSDYNSDSDIPF